MKLNFFGLVMLFIYSQTEKEDLPCLQDRSKLETGSKPESRAALSPDPRSEELNLINETIKEEGRQEEQERGLRRGEKKKSKSSYSIPALCQISVNIGTYLPGTVGHSNYLFREDS